MTHVIEVDYFLGQTVRFRLDSSSVGLVTGMLVRESGIAYMVTWDNRQETTHFPLELAPSDQPSYRESGG